MHGSCLLMIARSSIKSKFNGNMFACINDVCIMTCTGRTFFKYTSQLDTRLYFLPNTCSWKNSQKFSADILAWGWKTCGCVYIFVAPSTGAMAMIKLALLYSMLASLSVQELRDVYGFTRLDLPWVLVELVLWAMIYRRGLNFEVPLDVRCIEFFAGSERSSQIAKAFSELGFKSLAFDLLRNLAFYAEERPCRPHEK